MAATFMYTDQPTASSKDRTELTLAQLDSLPTPSSVATRLLAVTSSDDSSARDVIELVEADASLTAAVLKMLHSANRGVSKDVTTVARAVTLLGFRTVRNAALSLQLCDLFGSRRASPQSSAFRQQLWRHNIEVACAAELLAACVVASRSDKKLVSEAFTCGLLHDIGKIALEACLPKSYARVLTHMERGLSGCDAEIKVFGFDHTTAGRHLVTRWRLPEPITECVWLHHQPPGSLPPSTKHPKCVELIQLANALVPERAVGGNAGQTGADADALALRLAMKPDDLPAVLSRLPSRTEPLAELLGLGSEQDSDESDADRSATLLDANRELGRLNAELIASNRLLALRSQCLRVLDRVSGRVDASDGIGALCSVLTGGMRELVGTDCCVGFLPSVDGASVYVCASRRTQPESMARLIEMTARNSRVNTDTAPNNAVVAGFVVAPPACEPIWQRAVGSKASQPLWLLALGKPGADQGGLLVSATAGDMRSLLDSPDECAALATSLGYSIDSARLRAKSQRMSDELLEMNRRLNSAQEQAVRARSLSTIAAMAGGAAHELNNPLSVIAGRAQMELAGCESETLAGSLRTILDQANDAATIVTELMRFAKPEAPRPESIVLTKLLEPLCQHWSAGSRLPAGQPTLTTTDRNVAIFADASQLAEILDAVLSNAAGATQGKTARVNINSPSRASDETVRIVIEDNGVGMTRDVASHACDPFFSSRPAGRGRGLGLARAYRFVQINGGRLWLESTTNVGTIVTIELPARPPQT